MGREIRETPARIGELLAEGQDEVGVAAAAIAEAAPRWAMIAGRGTSDHAATYGRYLFETMLGMPVGLSAPSVASVSGAPVEWRGGLLVAVSQSGQSPDIVTVVSTARAAGAVTVVVTNDPGSPLADAGEWTIDCRAGEERSVAATKTYVAQLVVLALLVERIRPDGSLRRAIDALPALLARALDRSEPWLSSAGIVEAFASADRAMVLSRGYNFATALEVALKLKEACGLFADGYSTADLEHGPVTLAGPGVPVLAIRPPGGMGARVDDVVTRLAGAGVAPWSIGVDGMAGARALDLDLEVPDALSPAVLALPGQLLAEAVARVRGLDPDAPIGLAKVTRTT